PIDYEPTLDQSISGMASARGVEPAEAMYDALLADDGRAVSIVLGANYANGNLDMCHDLLVAPTTVSSLSDAGAHVSMICGMAMPTFQLAHWVRDRRRGDRVPVELAVAKQTGAAAQAFGFRDRGTLEVGKRGDVNVIDLDRLDLGLPTLRRDLPAGGSRFVQL